MLLGGYASGIFPMADSRDDPEVFWVSPEIRGVIPLDRFHVSRSLRKTLKRERFTVTVDRAFARVVAACADAGPGRETTWINHAIERACIALHRAGHAHSVECWSRGALAGGLYGVRLAGAFFGESMFSRATDASKVALAHLVARLAHGRFRLLDVQFMTDHLRRFGAEEVPRETYLALLADALAVADADFYSLPRESTQSRTQIS